MKNHRSTIFSCARRCPSKVPWVIYSPIPFQYQKSCQYERMRMQKRNIHGQCNGTVQTRYDKDRQCYSANAVYESWKQMRKKGEKEKKKGHVSSQKQLERGRVRRYVEWA